MLTFLYTLVIFPVEQIIQLSHVFVFHILRNHGFSIIAISIIVSTLILPLSLMAEKQQQAEREKQKQMKGMRDNIKAVFKGDKRFMMLSTLYRQNNYHPVYALRSSLELFIQIPFFIAAWHFLSNLGRLNGTAFWFINDLSAPDGFLWGGINLLPILMILINVISGAIYTNGLAIKDKVQVYSISIIFFILLYNSPAALVLYWTCNNIYNLIKNILLKTKNAKQIISVLILLFGVSLVVWQMFFRRDSIDRPLLELFFVIVFLAMFLLIPVWKKIWRIIKRKIDIKNTALELPGKTFFLSLMGLFLLIGLVIPSGLIASNVEQFSFLQPFSSPLPYIGIILTQSLGILLWLLCIYFLFDRRAKILLAIILTFTLGVFLINAFVFIGNYGAMTPDLHFLNFRESPSNQKIINIIAMLIVCVAMLLLLMWKRKKVLLSIQSIVVIALLCLGVVNIVNIKIEYQAIQGSQDKERGSSFTLGKEYTFSRTGKNVLLIVLDSAVSFYVPYIFEEKPELRNSFKGFTFFPNTVTHGPSTIQGMPGIFGGYYYTPLEIQKRTDEFWVDKFLESYQVLPRIMAEAGFKVAVYNQQWMDFSLYNRFDNIRAGRNLERFTSYYLSRNRDFNFKDYYRILYDKLIRFSFFRVSPLILHKLIYDRGRFLSGFDTLLDSANYSHATINNFAALYVLPYITEITDENINSAVMFINKLPHSPAFFEAPYYIPVNTITNKGAGPFAHEKHYHVNIASFILLARWFDFLKENGVYDNTRIIIVSDHGGRGANSRFSGNIVLPNGMPLEDYNVLLMLKDFYDDFDLRTDNTFMTNADVPHLLTEGLIQDLINPFTGKELIKQKCGGVFVSGSITWNPRHQRGNRLNIGSDEWMHVHTNIFDPANWSMVNVEY
ncbi:MAG: YidC/Oxa1 family membrane protein insertase [Spirochaetes bacterium]|nr:YidC/Oxa1 family membrane protein insertase [Spirochaetota bacterium]